MSAETRLQQFVSQQKRLLELELHADDDTGDATLKDINGDGGGFYLRNVDVIDTSVGLYGRTVVSFGQQAASRDSNDAESKKSAASSSRALLAAHRLTVGDEVEILPKNGKAAKSTKTKRVGGVICAVDDYTISIALEEKRRQSSNEKKASNKKNEKDNEETDDDILGGSPPYTLVPRSGVEVHQKMMTALDELGRHGVNHPIAGDVILSAFEPDNCPIGSENELSKTRVEELEKEYNLASTKLDYSQREAVIFALNSNSPISLIHGPPGTGKTTTVAELIRCAVNIKKWKVLVTAPSNVAVDNVLERVMSLESENTTKTGRRKNSKNQNSQKIKAVRLGHPARIQQSIQKYSLESLVQTSDGTEIVQDCRRELNNHLRTLSNPKSRPPEKRNAYREMKSLRKEIRTREEKVVGEILRHANVVLATNVGAAGSVFRHMVDVKGEPVSFDLVIIDEAAQALEASCWISLLRGNRAVLAGDHCQLPPTIKCTNREVQTELGKTLFERLMTAYDSNKNRGTNKPSKMLEVQYRMHQDISEWASAAMYNGKLISHESVKHRKLSSLPKIEERMKDGWSSKDEEDALKALQNVTLTLIDTTGCNFYEMTTEAGSRYNEGEAELVVSHVKSLLVLGLHAEDIAVITPYNGQVELLRKQLLSQVPKLEIRSVDGFQGGEREAVVLSLVRSSERGGDSIGFLRDKRRLNVAVTRAKRHLCLICDSETVTQNKFIKGLVDWIEQKGNYRSAAEIVSPNSLNVHIPSADKINKISQLDRRKDQARNDKTISSKGKSNSEGNKPAKKKEVDIELEGSSDELKPNDDKYESNTTGTAKQDALKEGAKRRALMNTIDNFSTNGKKGDKLVLADLSSFELVVAHELASQLGLGSNDNTSGDNSLTLHIIKEVRNNFTQNEVEDSQDKNTTKFSHLDIDEDDEEESSKDSGACTSGNSAQNSLLKDLAMERAQRQASQQQIQSNVPSQTKSKKNKKKKKGQKLGGEKKAAKESDEDLDGLDDMAFLDAQIEKVQTSHGREIDAKGKSYKSIINGVLLTKHDRAETKRTNTAVSNVLHAKIKAKSDDRIVKKKKGK